MKTKEQVLKQNINELIEWLNQECPAVAPPLEPYTNYDLSHDFCEGLRVRLDYIQSLHTELCGEEQTSHRRAKEILDSYFSESGSELNKLQKKWALLAMQEYADLKVREKLISLSFDLENAQSVNLREVLHNALTEYIQDSDYNNMYAQTVSEFVDTYLSTHEPTCQVTDDEIEKRAQEVYESHMALEDESPVTYSHKSLCLHEKQAYKAGAWYVQEKSMGEAVEDKIGK